MLSYTVYISSPTHFFLVSSSLSISSPARRCIHLPFILSFSLSVGIRDRKNFCLSSQFYFVWFFPPELFFHRSKEGGGMLSIKNSKMMLPFPPPSHTLRAMSLPPNCMGFAKKRATVCGAKDATVKQKDR